MSEEAKTIPEPAVEAKTPPKTLKITCPDGPGGEHEWENNGDVATCVHCAFQSTVGEVIRLYQTGGIEVKRRLDHELGHKTDRFGVSTVTKGECKSDKEQELYEQSAYFQERLQTEIDNATKMRNEASKAGKAMKEAKEDAERMQKSNSSIRADRDKWKTLYNELVDDLKEHSTNLLERLNRKV